MRAILALSLLLTTLPGVASAADPDKEGAKARPEQAQGDSNASRSASRPQAKTVQARSAYEAELATIKAQADAADAQCGKLDEANQHACRESVRQGSQRATQAAKTRHQQAVKGMQ